MFKPIRTVGRPVDILVVGGGPIGLSTALALGVALRDANSARTVHLVDANNILDGNLGGLSMSGPYAAGQIIIHSFASDSVAMGYGRRTAQALRELTGAGVLHAEPRPWIVCARKGNSPVDVIAREVLDIALRDGRLDGCERIHGEALSAIPGLRADAIDFAVRDPHAMGVDPRRLVSDLTRWVVGESNAQGHFGYRVTEFDGAHFLAENETETLRIRADAAVLCTGVHRVLFPGALPKTSVVHLHVFDHRDAAHVPKLNCLVAGETTIARYEGFGPERKRLVPHLSSAARSLDINALLTDVPGLRRMLDTHIVDPEEATVCTEQALAAIGDELESLIHPSLLLGRKESACAITERTVARYVKCPREGDDPILAFLDAPLPALYVQPSDGRGLCQCIALGEAAAKLVLGAFE